MLKTVMAYGMVYVYEYLRFDTLWSASEDRRKAACAKTRASNPVGSAGRHTSFSLKNVLKFPRHHQDCVRWRAAMMRKRHLITRIFLRL